MERHLLKLTDSALSEELAELADEITRIESYSSLPEVLKTRFPGHEGYELQVRTVAGELLFRSEGIESTRSAGPRCLGETVSISQFMRVSRSTAAGPFAWQVVRSPDRRGHC